MKNLKITVLALCTTALLSAQDLSKDQIPENIQSTFQQNFTNAKDVDWEKSGNDYKVEFEIDNKDHDIWYYKNGMVIKFKKEISENEIPQEVVSTITDKYPDYKIDSAEVEEQDNQKIYKIEIDKGWNKERELVIDATGKIVSDLED